MGMACDIQALTERQVKALVADPELTWKIIMAHVDKTAGALFEEPLCEKLSLDKSWGILEYLLQRVAKEVDSYEELISGDPIGRQGDVYGPSLRSIADTKEFAAFLEPITVDQLLSHFDGEDMQEEGVYLVGYDNIEEEGVEDELLEYAEEHFVALRDYVLKAAALSCGLLLVVG